jgi:hypothetical protein
MDVIYAAERASIAELLRDYVKRDVKPEDIDVIENPAETGSFFVGWKYRRYRLSPGGEIVSDLNRSRARLPWHEPER